MSDNVSNDPGLINNTTSQNDGQNSDMYSKFRNNHKNSEIKYDETKYQTAMDLFITPLNITSELGKLKDSLDNSFKNIYALPGTDVFTKQRHLQLSENQTKQQDINKEIENISDLIKELHNKLQFEKEIVDQYLNETNIDVDFFNKFSKSQLFSRAIQNPIPTENNDNRNGKFSSESSTKLKSVSKTSTSSGGSSSYKPTVVSLPRTSNVLQSAPEKVKTDNVAEIKGTESIDNNVLKSNENASSLDNNADSQKTVDMANDKKDIKEGVLVSNYQDKKDTAVTGINDTVTPANGGSNGIVSTIKKTIQNATTSIGHANNKNDTKGNSNGLISKGSKEIINKTLNNAQLKSSIEKIRKMTKIKSINLTDSTNPKMQTANAANKFIPPIAGVAAAGVVGIGTGTYLNNNPQILNNEKKNKEQINKFFNYGDTNKDDDDEWQEDDEIEENSSTYSDDYESLIENFGNE